MERYDMTTRRKHCARVVITEEGCTSLVSLMEEITKGLSDLVNEMVYFRVPTEISIEVNRESSPSYAEVTFYG